MACDARLHDAHSGSSAVWAPVHAWRALGQLRAEESIRPLLAVLRERDDDEAVDLGLCSGWISGLRKPYDQVYYLQKYVPRRPRGRWSQVNVDKVEELIAAGRMRQPGLKEIEAAKADGRWNLAL